LVHNYQSRKILEVQQSSIKIPMSEPEVRVSPIELDASSWFTIIGLEKSLMFNKVE
jgi:hypothetical protein